MHAQAAILSRCQVIGEVTPISGLTKIIDKLIVKDRVIPDEVEEVFFNGAHYRFVEKGHQCDEDVYAAMGQTDAGRHLIVLFIHKPGSMALILSARDMDQKERRRYEQR